MPKTEKAAEMAFDTFGNFASASSEAARKAFERQMALVGEMNAFGRENFAAFGESAKAATKAFETMAERAAGFVKESVEEAMATGRTVSTAKSVKEAVEVQAEYAKSYFDRYLETVNAMTGLMAASVKGFVEPLNTQAGEFVAMMQRKV